MRHNWTILILLTLILCISCITTEQEPILMDTSEMSDDLLRASREGNTDKVQTLLDAGIEVNAAADDGITALTNASAEGHSEVAYLLIEAGVTSQIDLN